MHLSETETNNIARLLPELVATLRGLCLKNGRRFGQLVGSNGRILKIVEV